MQLDWVTIFTIVLYPLMILAAIGYLSLMTLQRRKNMRKMIDNIKEKLTSHVLLTAKDVVHIGRGFGLSPKNSTDAIYKLYAEAHDQFSYESLKELVVDIEKEEAFDELPDEVKPSLSRIVKLIDTTNDPTDKHILLPITNTLLKYVELKSEQEKIKKQTYRAYVITVVSFVVGASSLYYTLKAPSEADIKKAVEQVIIEKSLPAPTESNGG